MTISERVRRLAEEFGPEGPESRAVFAVELARHFLEVDRAARDGSGKVARLRQQIAVAAGAREVAAACDDVARLIEDGRIEPG